MPVANDAKPTIEQTQLAQSRLQDWFEGVEHPYLSVVSRGANRTGTHLLCIAIAANPDDLRPVNLTSEVCAALGYTRRTLGPGDHSILVPIGAFASGVMQSALSHAVWADDRLTIITF